MDTSDFAGEAWSLGAAVAAAAAAAAAASGESATSDSEEVPGLIFVFLEGDGLSTGAGVARPSFVFVGSSA